MHQLVIPKDILVEIDFTDPSVPVSVKQFRPLLWREGNSFCCLLGPDMVHGVFGCGSTAEETLTDWSDNLQYRLDHPQENDCIVQYVEDVLHSGIKDGGGFI